ncbi:uncharacterized protein N7498_005827 [Penicillium cinerascens]|uniref:Uncharacterized protein n=1 Tax=Penicillium cinerascens TaxID=70096 RepID=A0A9W9T0I1_9EURO|nr:uncharacterized protein N7498_005827 [Penicillium cinerascens]KAJ5204948.1 hypothetical protein N7498_005827 [Penicillium cinerascens]
MATQTAMERTTTNVNEDTVQTHRLGLNITVVEETKNIEGSRIGEGGYSDLSQLTAYQRDSWHERFSTATVGIHQDAIFASLV